MKALVAYFLKNRVVTFTFAVLLVAIGTQSFRNMARLEDPEFTIKDALVITPYPGASPQEVEEEVTDLIETSVQAMEQLDEVRSRSERGLSTVTVSMRDNYDKDSLPQVWDELRRKVGDAAKYLPPGAGPSMVVDDYGDVYGVFFILYGNEYSYAELKDVADMLKRELLLVEDVAKIQTMGERTEAIIVELNRDRLAQLAIPSSVIIRELQNKNQVVDAGKIQTGVEYIVLAPDRVVQDLADFQNIRISIGEHQFRLGDLATIRRDYISPANPIVRFNGNNGIAIGISTRAGGNVVKMGQALDARMQTLIKDIPLGIDFGIVSLQSDAVTKAINSFIVSLLQAVGIVIVVLLLFMGLRCGLLIGVILLITIMGSFIFLTSMDVALERISLGALIIALGMLVDNAIVVVDGMLIRMNKGEKGYDAAVAVVQQTAIPLLGATAIAILAFASIGTSQDSAGEFCSSLYSVILVSLSLSWVTAITITPLFGMLFLKGKPTPGKNDPYNTRFYRRYRKFLHACIRKRWISLATVGVVFVLAILGFRFVENAFFPPSTRPQFLVDLWLPQGSHLDATRREAEALEVQLLALDGVTKVTTVVGQGPLRFLLTYSGERKNDAYAQLLVDVEDASLIDDLIRKVDNELGPQLPDAEIYGYKFELGPGSKGKIEIRFYGNHPDDLRELEQQALALFREHTNTKAVRSEWRNRIKVFEPEILEEQAGLLGISRADIAAAIREAFDGRSVGVYREGNLLLPIKLKAPETDAPDVANILNLQIWSPVAKRSVTLSQVVRQIHTRFEDDIIVRRNRKRCLSVFADPVEGTAAALLAELRPAIEAIPLPQGIEREWGGEYKNSKKANASIAASIPMFMGAMVVLTILLFNSLRQTIVIWLCVPLIIVGVAFGLLGFQKPFNFMAILGFLSLVGMMIKNAIVLIDEINAQNALGITRLEAVLRAGTSRLRPVAMASTTTALGMLPLFADAFFAAMAVTIIFGLVAGTILTMVILPVIYTVIFRIPVK